MDSDSVSTTEWALRREVRELRAKLDDREREQPAEGEADEGGAAIQALQKDIRRLNDIPGAEQLIESKKKEVEALQAKKRESQPIHVQQKTLANLIFRKTAAKEETARQLSELDTQRVQLADVLDKQGKEIAALRAQEVALSASASSTHQATEAMQLLDRLGRMVNGPGALAFQPALLELRKKLQEAEASEAPTQPEGPEAAAKAAAEAQAAAEARRAAAAAASVKEAEDARRAAEAAGQQGQRPPGTGQPKSDPDDMELDPEAQADVDAMVSGDVDTAAWEPARRRRAQLELGKHVRRARKP